MNNLRYVFTRIALLLTTSLLMSCSDIFGGSNIKDEVDIIWDQGCWWIHNGSAEKGIKTILDEYTSLWEYSESGRLLRYCRTDDSGKYSICEAITYNDKNLPDTVVYYQNDQSDGRHTTTLSFEYQNQGRYCPYNDWMSGFNNMSSQGLVPGLSKITFSDTRYKDYSLVITYIFDKDILTIQVTEYGKGYPDTPREEYVFEYKGSYPYQCKKYDRYESAFIGPITYLANGGFDTYVEGKFDKDTGIVTEKKTVTYDKRFPDAFLPSIIETDYYSLPSGEQTRWEKTIYDYNEYGDCILVDTNYSDGYIFKTEYSYNYDSWGNWINGILKRGNEEFSFERVIEYY